MYKCKPNVPALLVVLSGINLVKAAFYQSQTIPRGANYIVMVVFEWMDAICVGMLPFTIIILALFAVMVKNLVKKCRTKRIPPESPYNRIARHTMNQNYTHTISSSDSEVFLSGNYSYERGASTPPAGRLYTRYRQDSGLRSGKDGGPATVGHGLHTPSTPPSIQRDTTTAHDVIIRESPPPPPPQQHTRDDKPKVRFDTNQYPFGYYD